MQFSISITLENVKIALFFRPSRSFIFSVITMSSKLERRVRWRFIVANPLGNDEEGNASFFSQTIDTENRKRKKRRRDDKKKRIEIKLHRKSPNRRELRISTLSSGNSVITRPLSLFYFFVREKRERKLK